MIMTKDVLDRVQKEIVSLIGGEAELGTPPWFFGDFFIKQVAETRARKRDVNVEDLVVAIEAAYVAACLILGVKVPSSKELKDQIFEKVVERLYSLEVEIATEIIWIMIDGCTKENRARIARLKSGSIAANWHRDQSLVGANQKDCNYFSL